MAEPAARGPRYEDLFEIPEHLVAEIVDGEIHATPRPSPRHARASSVIGSNLLERFDRRTGDPDRPGGWSILDGTELHLGSDIVVPDLAGWRRERLPRIPEAPYFTLAPDWVCEVLSPTTEQLDRSKKKRIYAREGVAHLWLVNPVIRTLEIYRKAGAFWQELATYAGDEKVRAEPFEAVEIDLRRWWEIE